MPVQGCGGLRASLASFVKEEKLNAFKLKLDPAQALASIPEQIRDSLAAGYGRYSDLFRAMDGDESGTISRRRCGRRCSSTSAPSTRGAASPPTARRTASTLTGYASTLRPTTTSSSSPPPRAGRPTGIDSESL